MSNICLFCFYQLQHLVSDPICQQCVELFQREQRQPKESSGAGGLCATAYMRLGAELSYQRKAEKTMADENCFKIYIVCIFISEFNNRLQCSLLLILQFNMMRSTH